MMDPFQNKHIYQSRNIFRIRFPDTSQDRNKKRNDSLEWAYCGNYGTNCAPDWATCGDCGSSRLFYCT